MRSVIATVFATTVVLSVGAQAQQAIFIDHEKVDAAFSTTGANRPKAEWVPCGPATGEKIGECSTFLNTPGLTVRVMHREKFTPAESHPNTSHIWYIVDGEADFVTGGTFTNFGRGTDNGELKGGDIRRVKKGDMVIVPAGTPHWFKQLHGTLSLYQINMDLSKPIKTSQ